MSLRARQSEFVYNIAKLIFFAYQKGYELTFGEADRTKCQQYLYLEGYKIDKIFGSLKLVKTASKSKTMFSKHLNRMAIDLNVFKDGEYLTKKEDIQFLGDFWEQLDERNEWGGNWNFVDTPHFQMK